VVDEEVDPVVEDELDPVVVDELEDELELDEVVVQGGTNPLLASSNWFEVVTMVQETRVTPLPAAGVTIMVKSDVSVNAVSDHAAIPPSFWKGFCGGFGTGFVVPT
jgi:hypothetical protein